MALVGTGRVAWEDLKETDWIYGLVTRFAQVEGHQVHYPTPPAELVRILEGRKESGALRHLAEARLALGDRKGALIAMQQWAQAEGTQGQGAQAWSETATWAASHGEMAAAFEAASKAFEAKPSLEEEAKRTLADQRIHWAMLHPDLADPIALHQAKAALFPRDGAAFEAWLRALEKAGRLDEADRAFSQATALSPERRLLMRSDLLTDNNRRAEALKVLDEALLPDRPWSLALRQAFARRVDQALPGSPGNWRNTLEQKFDAPALLRLATYFQGKGRADSTLDLLRQMERRYGSTFIRRDHQLLARLYEEIDAMPEAFRATLAAAHLGDDPSQQTDLAKLGRLALRAGGRPLALGVYNDESYRWAAELDRTPGFWTGGLSFLLTGLEWKSALDHLENESLPDRTFALARNLCGELAQRNSAHSDLPALRSAIMERHVERGEGQEALKLLPMAEKGMPSVADEARRIALLAARQTEIPMLEEMRLMKARLRFLASDGSRPNLHSQESDYERSEDAEEGQHSEGDGDRPWAQSRLWSQTNHNAPAAYGQVLEESLSRLEHRDASHQASLDLILSELDRLPQAEDLWMNLASRLEGWNLDDGLGPRYEQALQRFPGSGIWARTARWYAKRNHASELRNLATSLADRFRGAAIFERASGANEIRVEIPDQPPVDGRIRLVLWADWVRFQALQRFPHSPRVFQEAQHLMTQNQWERFDQTRDHSIKQVAYAPVVPDNLMENRRWALLFADEGQRELYFAQAMKSGSLESRLKVLEARQDRTPVEDLLLFEGWARLSHFEQAAPAADRLCTAYPGDPALAQRALSLHRSLNALEGSHGTLAKALVERSAQAVENPIPLWTELGELEEDRGRPMEAMSIWKHILERDPRNPERISELATLLWDYGHDAEALAVVEAGRERLHRPRFYAFETGVLRENVKDVEGAVREYLDAVRPESSQGYGSWYDQDQRSLRRLSQLLGRAKVYRIVAKRIQSLNAGNAEDERALAAFLPLARLELPTPDQTGLDADWIDQEDLPRDAVGREAREAQREANRPAENDAITRIGHLLLEKTQAMIAGASSPAFLDAVEAWAGPIMEPRWKPERIAQFQADLLARRAALAPSDEERIRQEVTLADFLASHQCQSQADSVWKTLDTRIGKLPEGTSRIAIEVQRAAYLERSKGAPSAAVEWRRLTARYPWSLGVLEDRLSFLDRNGMEAEGRDLLESIIPKAAPEHREPFLERLTRSCLTASELPRARKAVELLLAQEGLSEPRRLGAIHLLARLSYRENPAWNANPLIKIEGPRFSQDLQADLYHQLAQAADLESAPKAALSLWIEALNRRTERIWLNQASRSASHAGQSAELLGFFEKQQQRSPRDVRWAVAVRDLRTAFHQVEGAIAAAKSAVAVRPDREDLWREAAILLVRADRIQEAADYLEGWNKPRAADEGVVRWRGDLFARAGNGEKALALEKAALEAFHHENPKFDADLQERRARAALRMLERGYPALALRVYAKGSAKGDVLDLQGSRVDLRSQCMLALLNGQFSRLLQSLPPEGTDLRTPAAVLSQYGRPEQKEEILNLLLDQLMPAGSASPDNASLSRWWPFIGDSSLERALRVGLAQRLLKTRSGPWIGIGTSMGLNPGQNRDSMAFLDRVGAECVVPPSQSNGAFRMVFREPDLTRLWASDLVRRDRSDELLAFLEPRWQELRAQVKGGQNLTIHSPRLAWASSLDEPEAIQAWVRGFANRPEKRQEVAELMGDRRIWDRFWVLAARNWDIKSLVATLDEPRQLAWFRIWEPVVQDPILLARRHTTESVNTALGRLVQGQTGAVQDPLVQKLRGPLQIGEILGKNSTWIWGEFAPRRNPKGEIIEDGENRVIGNGVDLGRLPGAFWGERPGEGWYALEALIRYRQGDHSAALVCLDQNQRGAETERRLLAMRLARRMGDLNLALEIEAGGGPARDPRWLEAQVSLLCTSGRKPQAQKRFAEFIRRSQEHLSEAEYRNLKALSEEQRLPSPLEMMDPEIPVGPAFLAFLEDHQSEAARRFHTADETGYRAALGRRWQSREAQLSAAQIRRWTHELWTLDAAPLPTQGLAKLGRIWPHAAAWLRKRPVVEREQALQDLEEALLPSAAEPRIFAEFETESEDDGTALLAIRLHLFRNEKALALAAVDRMLARTRQDRALGFPHLQEPRPEETEGGEREDSPVQTPSVQAASEPLVSRLRLWLKPFREIKDATEVEGRFRQRLKEARQQSIVSIDAWQMALELSPANETEALIQNMEEAWFRGEITPESLGNLIGTLATALPQEVSHWLSRWPVSLEYSQTRQRAEILAAANQNAAAAKLLTENRKRCLWQGTQEIQAFDQWRRLGAMSDAHTPPTWTRALAFWNPKTGNPTGNPTLADHLKLHPLDSLSARVALRTLAPGDEETILRTALSLNTSHGLSSRSNSGGNASRIGLLGDTTSDRILRIRLCRNALPLSWRAARNALGGSPSDNLARLLMDQHLKAGEVNAALADLTRLSAHTSNETEVRKLMAQLSERKAPELKSLRLELAMAPTSKVEAFRIQEGRPAPIRPRDLTWSMLASILKSEGQR